MRGSRILLAVTRRRYHPLQQPQQQPPPLHQGDASLVWTLGLSFFGGVVLLCLLQPTYRDSHKAFMDD